MNILVLDNYDSFTYNIVHILKKIEHTNIDVIRNDKIELTTVINYDKIILSNVGINLNPIDDTMLLSYVLDAGKFRHNLDDLAKIYLDHETIKYKDIVGVGKKEKTFDEVSINDAYIYAAEDSDVTFQLYKILKKKNYFRKVIECL